jgi:hypothetical protein
MTVISSEVSIGTETAAAPSALRSFQLSIAQAFALPFLFTAGLLAFALLERVRDNQRLWWSFVGAAAALLVWNAVLVASARRAHRTFAIEVSLRAQHYLQACAHTSIFLYWGWYWRPVYASYYLIIAQVIFAYAFDILLSWSRRDTYTLGFGPFPVVFSMNLFLWFRPDWFYLQFLMIGLGFAAKELIRWDKSGRRVHIFNPSSFALMAFSIGLLLTGTTDITWGKDIAVTQFYPPHMYLFLFLIGLPGQYLFGVTTMTMSAVTITYLWSAAYFAATGVYFFGDSYIPIAVFLGMHLLFTDPSTSPRSELGRIFFGVLYGAGVIALYQALGRAGLPPFYDKLLPVPILNVAIQSIDRAARSKLFRWIDPANLGRSLVGRRRNLAYICVWAMVFALMSAAHGLGDDQPGQWIPFWQQACAKNRSYSCKYLTNLEANYCAEGSGWACNEFGIQEATRAKDRAGAVITLERGCVLGFPPACGNARQAIAGRGEFQTAPPALDDYPIVLRGSKGPITERDPAKLYDRACREGWVDACQHGVAASGK